MYSHAALLLLLFFPIIGLWPLYPMCNGKVFRELRSMYVVLLFFCLLMLLAYQKCSLAYFCAIADREATVAISGHGLQVDYCFLLFSIVFYCFPFLTIVIVLLSPLNFGLDVHVGMLHSGFISWIGVSSSSALQHGAALDCSEGEVSFKIADCFQVLLEIYYPELHCLVIVCSIIS